MGSGKSIRIGRIPGLTIAQLHPSVGREAWGLMALLLTKARGPEYVKRPRWTEAMSSQIPITGVGRGGGGSVCLWGMLAVVVGWGGLRHYGRNPITKEYGQARRRYPHRTP